METLTPILTNASELFNCLFLDKFTLFEISKKETQGYRVKSILTEIATDVEGLIQSLSNAPVVDSTTIRNYSIKFPINVNINVGMIVRVDQCNGDSSLNGKCFLIDQINQSGITVIKKAIAQLYDHVNHEIGDVYVD